MIGLSWAGLVRSVALAHDTTVTDADIEFILWECTAFPMAGLDHTRQQIIQHFETRTS